MPGPEGWHGRAQRGGTESLGSACRAPHGALVATTLDQRAVTTRGSWPAEGRRGNGRSQQDEEDRLLGSGQRSLRRPRQGK